MTDTPPAGLTARELIESEDLFPDAWVLALYITAWPTLGSTQPIGTTTEWEKVRQTRDREEARRLVEEAIWKYCDPAAKQPLNLDRLVPNFDEFELMPFPRLRVEGIDETTKEDRPLDYDEFMDLFLDVEHNCFRGPPDGDHGKRSVVFRKLRFFPAEVPIDRGSQGGRPSKIAWIWSAYSSLVPKKEIAAAAPSKDALRKVRKRVQSDHGMDDDQRGLSDDSVRRAIKKKGIK